MKTKEETVRYSQRLERDFQHKESQTPFQYFNQIHMRYLMHMYTISATCALHHLQKDRITCSKPSAFYMVVCMLH